MNHTENFGKNTLIGLGAMLLAILVLSAILPPITGPLYIAWLLFWFVVGWFTPNVADSLDPWGKLQRLRSKD